MDRDIDPQERQEPDPRPSPRVAPRPEESQVSREHDLARIRGHIYRTSPAEREILRDIGRFRTVTLADLAHYRYQGNAALMQQDLRSLRAQGLVQTRTVWAGPKSEKLALVALTKVGKKLMQENGSGSDQALYSGFVKPAEVRHDAAIYRMYQAEKQKIEQAGGRIRGVVLDYELKQKVYSPLARARGLAPLDYARRQAEVARQNGLKVIEGRIPLPDLRIEYEASTGDLGRVDLELATEHYHGPALQAKAEAGFKMYAADDSASRLSRVLEEREITASILSL
ncbi:MAG TPA: hypothetical protein VGG72_35065 [Bryobacteraceae bacterium]|jgi:hypothetical protein